MFEYKTEKVCARKIRIEIIEGRINFVEFLSGCDGNLQGISRLVEGMHIDEAIQKLEGIQCGPRPTSCPDQLSKALQAYKNKF